MDACAPFAAIRITKALVGGSSVANGDGTFTISYNLTVSNLVAGATTYDLSDRLRFGAGVTITSATVGNTSPGSIITNAAWNGTSTQQIVSGQTIAAATNATTPTAHVYRVTAIASVAEGTATYASSDCALAGGEAGTGFRNDGTVAFPGGGASVAACAPFPIIGLSKVLGSVALQPDGSYRVPYTVTVTNRGAGAGTYSLSDGFHFGTGVNIVPGTTTISATPGSVVPSPTWNGVANQQIVTNQAIAVAASAAAPTNHVFTVGTRVAIDPATASNTSTDCVLDGGDTGTGARNDATVISNGESLSANACAAFPILAITKSLFGLPVENGDGTTTISYDVTVSNRGGGPGTYDLDDQLRFGAGVGIVSASVTATPGTITPRPQWNGVSDQRVVTGQVIAAQTGVGPVLHVFRVIAIVTIDGATTTANSADCTLSGGETGTGFRNDARLIHGTTTTVTDCAPFPAVAVTKALVGTPVENGDGTITIDYDVTVTSTGAVATSYNLADTLRFGTGATIVPGSATVSNTTPGTIITNPAWNGVSVTAVVNGVPIGIGVVHIYHVTATATTDPATATVGSSDCSLAGAETGTGFRNDATLTVNGGPASATACAPFPALGITKSVAEVELGTDGIWDLAYDVTVSNLGSGAGTYDLVDAFRFGTGVSIVAGSAGVTATPGSITPSATWNGVGDTTVVTGQAVPGATDHVYRITVRVTIDLSTATAASSDCTLVGPETGTGFRNDGAVTTNGITSGTIDCAPFPLLSMSKTLVGDPVANGDGTWTIAYDLGLGNAGAGPARYDLADEFRFGLGTTVVSATVTTSSVGAGSPSATWDGETDTTVVTGVTLAAFSTHVYRVTATAAIDEQTATAATSDCDTSDSADTGFRNTSTVTWGDHRIRSSGSTPARHRARDRPNRRQRGVCAIPDPVRCQDPCRHPDGEPRRHPDGALRRDCQEHRHWPIELRPHRFLCLWRGHRCGGWQCVGHQYRSRGHHHRPGVGWRDQHSGRDRSAHRSHREPRLPRDRDGHRG